ncbi:hypothetical protein HQ520_09215, partial [bacterium]|nr:hypothetical protein [bacterium]
LVDWLLLIPYLFLSAAVALTLFLSGRILLRALGSAEWDVGSRAVRTVFAYGFGLAAWSFLISCLGLFGQVRIAAVAIVAGAVWLTSWRYGWELLRLPTCAEDSRGPADPTVGWRWAQRVMIVYGIFLAVWITVGAAAPDCSQDAMWYHLSVPRAWAHRGTVEAFALNMPSNYALGFEALYAALLLFSNEVACSLFYAQVMIVTLAAVALVSSRLIGPGAGWIAGSLAMTFYASSTIRVPIGAGNDFGAALLLFLSLAALASPREILARAPVGWRMGVIVGFLGRSAAAMKIVAAGFWAPVVLVLAPIALWRSDSIRRSFWLGLVIAAAVAYAPWALRNLIQGCGNPFFPFALLPFSLTDGYESIARVSADLNGVFPPSPSGIAQAIADLPRRIGIFLTSADIVAPALPILTCAGILFGAAPVRRLSIALLLQTCVLVMMRGSNELTRYFALCYPAVVVVGTALLRQAWKARPGSRRILAFGFAAILLGSVCTHWSQQIRWMRFKTIAWPCHPVLTAESRARYVVGKETAGPLVVPFDFLSERLPTNARVLMPDCPWPFYLDRYYIWSCEVSPPPLESYWKGLNARAAADWLESKGVTHLLYLHEPHDPRIANLIDARLLRQIAFDDALVTLENIHVFEVRGAPGTIDQPRNATTP